MAIQFTTRSMSRPAKVSSRHSAYAQPPQKLKSRLVDLLAPLQLLDQRLRQMLEIRHILLGTAFESFLLGGVVPVCAPASAIAAGSSLANLQQTFGLSDFDIEVVLMAIAPELDRRYERLYAQLQPNACRRPMQQLSLNVLCHSVAEQEQGIARFAPAAPLVRFGLIDIKANGSFSLNPAISRYLLGQPMSPQVEAYCQLSRPQSGHGTMGYIINSPWLLDLLSRIHDESVPDALTINFVGPGPKEQGAKAIAVAKAQPLLTVNLSDLLAGQQLSEAEVIHRVQQVLLQARLWNAILYLNCAEDLPAFHHRWLPSQHTSTAKKHTSEVVQSFFAQASAYAGTIIFSGQSWLDAAIASCQDIITIPFTAPCTDFSDMGTLLDSSWHNHQKTVPTPLSETEWFRQKVTGTVGSVKA